METIKTFSGSILGYIKESSNKLVATTFSGKILGYYDPRTNFTTDFYGKILFQGNMLPFLIGKENRL